MVYVGSKRRLAKDLIPIITKELKEDMYYVEPFVGGANLITNIDHKKKIGGDSNEYLIELLKYVQAGNTLPSYISRDEYYAVKMNKENYPKWYVGFVGFCCSYSGLFFHNYVRNGIKKKSGKIEDYQAEQINNLAKQNLNDINFICSSYEQLDIPLNSIVYCDPPYKNTITYNDAFNHDEFWQWVRDMTINGYAIYVSEYEAPKDFKCIWERKHTKNIGQVRQNTTEKLFIYESIK